MTLEASAMRKLILITPLLLAGCPADDGGGNTSTDAGVDAPVIAECLKRDHTTTVSVAGESIDLVWPVDDLGPVVPGQGDTTELPDLGCLNDEESITSEPLDAWACVDIFGPGETVVGLEVAVWADDGSDRSGTPPTTEGVVAGCDTIEADDEVMTAKVRALCDELCENRGMVHLPQSPGGVPIVARVRVGDVNGDGNRDLNDRLRMRFVDTWVYGVTLKRVEARGECAEDCGEGTCHRGVCVPATTSMLTAVAITENSYTTIPIVSGVGRIDGDADLLDGEGNGAVAGGISDCNDTAISGAAIASSGANIRTRTGYFQGEYPSPRKRATEGDATYVLLNHPPGEALVAAFVHNEICDDAHQEDCQCGGLEEGDLVTERSGERSTLKLIGGRRVRVYADSVTILSMRYGLMP